METIQPIMKRGRHVWNQTNMPATEFQKRIEKIRKEMKKEGIDVLLLYGNGINEYGNPCYISNFVLEMPRGTLVAIPQEGDATLIFEGFARGLALVKSKTWVEDVRPCGDISKECVKYLQERNFIPSTIGLVGLRHLMPYYQWQLLHESVRQCKMVDFDNIIRDMRMVKSQKECDQIRRASQVLTHALDLISNTEYPNMTERILEASASRSAFLGGAEDFRMLIAKPKEEKWAFRPVEDAQVSSGDSIIVYLAVEFERYWSEGIRTFVVEPHRLVQPKLENDEAWYKRIMDGMKPGKTLSQFYQETVTQLPKNNVDYITEYGLGQGIGLSLQEFPIINEEDATELRERMCLTLRLAVEHSEAGAIMIGNTVHLSKDGPEVLTK